MWPRPEIDEFGLVRYRGGWVAVSPLLEAALRPLLAELGCVVPRARLEDILWPDHDEHPRKLDTLMYRLRRRLRPLGLTIHTIRTQGFLLEAAGRDNEGAPWPIS
jgi:DNA-binding response OmpR family regulator